jgi:hypothetical protein
VGRHHMHELNAASGGVRALRSPSPPVRNPQKKETAETAKGSLGASRTPRIEVKAELLTDFLQSLLTPINSRTGHTR